MTRRSILMATLTAVALLAAACSSNGNGADAEGADSTSTSAAESTTTTEVIVDAVPVEVTPLVGVLGDSADTDYTERADGTSLFLPGTVSAHWYTAGDVWAVVYYPIPAPEVPVCPGNSIEVAPGEFSHVSSAPTLDEAACMDFPTLDPDASVQICGFAFVYETVIPISEEGTLYGTLEQAVPDDPDQVAVGATSTVTADAAAAPEIDPSAPAYAFPDELGGEMVCR